MWVSWVHNRGWFCCVLGLLLQSSPVEVSAGEKYNYDETQVGSYVLPDPLRNSDGSRLHDSVDWERRRRGEIFKLFETEVYGRSPGKPEGERFEVVKETPSPIGGGSVRREVVIRIDPVADTPKIRLTLYLPAKRQAPCPVFLGVNLFDPARVEEDFRKGAAEPSPHRTLEVALRRGYAVGNLYHGDMEEEKPEAWKQGVRGYYARKWDHDPQPDEWGAIAAWGWGLSRALDYAETDKDLDAKWAIAIGHSRQGKAALWAGARDERFVMVAANDSGEGGAALARRNYGETIRHLVTAFPAWFAGNYAKYVDHPEKLPVDQHELLALMAPRLLYVASAEEDKWADPKGEFLAALSASPVWLLFGLTGVGVEQFPAVNTPVGGNIGYHLRRGKHDLTTYDWERFLNFADRHRAGK